MENLSGMFFDLEISSEGCISDALVACILAKAIQARRLDEVARSLLALPKSRLTATGRALSEQAVATAMTITAETRALQEQTMERLASVGVRAMPEEGSAVQYQRIILRIAPEAVGIALHMAAQEGYPLAAMFSSGAAEALWRTTDHIDLMRRDAVSTRLTLRWRAPEPAPQWRKRLRPHLADYAFARLPAPLWPLYAPLRIVRLALERGTGRRSATRVPLCLAEVSLGTPEELLPPLLEFAGLTRDDLFLDIGCGDGRAVIAAARLSGCPALGVELNPTLAENARVAAIAAGVSELVSVVTGAAAAEHVAAASLVYMFQPPKTLGTLLPWTLAHLAPGARLLVHEQLSLDLQPFPDSSKPIFAANAMTVAHLWGASSAASF